jgi:hypothetical protein
MVRCGPPSNMWSEIALPNAALLPRFGIPGGLSFRKLVSAIR